MIGLPIDSVLPQIAQTLAENPSLVLQAPPGAGKTTGVPLHLLRSDWLGDNKIIMLEPRRLAARTAAIRMAELLGENLGETVGYRIRLEKKVSARTKIEVVTEGILTRMLQKDPELSGVGLVIFDEFHERSLQADLGLALCLEVQSALRDDLRLLVMSATLDGQAVSHLMGDAPVVTSEGRSFPVDIKYGRETERRNISFDMADKIADVLHKEQGSILAFLPGVGEIKRVESLLKAKQGMAGVEVYPLYGDLPMAKQRKAIEPVGNGNRKVVLATSIAETSLTIDGIRIIVDCGFRRSPRFDPSSGLTRLETIRVSKASADQRAGRAGRLEPGICYRLWPESQSGALSLQDRPEIQEADLCSLVLELLNWGATDPEELSWCTVPPKSSWKQAMELLRSLGAIDHSDHITDHGKKMSRLPVHPRLAHMLVTGKEEGAGWVACLIAALLTERDVLQQGANKTPTDLLVRIGAFAANRDDKGFLFDSYRVKQVKRTAEQYARALGVNPDKEFGMDCAGGLVSLAYPDRIGKLRKNTVGRFKLSGGKGAELDELDPLASKPYLVMTNIGGTGASARVYQAIEVSENQIRKFHAESIVPEDRVRLDDLKGIFLGEKVERIGEVILKATRVKEPDQEAIKQEILNLVRGKGLAILKPDSDLEHLCRRVISAGVLAKKVDWPDFSEAGLISILEAWLRPYLDDVSTLKSLQALNLKSILLSSLDWDKRQFLDNNFPDRIGLPTGNTARISYDDPQIPTLEVRLQELFGLSVTPSIFEGRVPLRLHLLSPARRPLQVTSDLAGFWANTYHDVKKDMKGRYPRHYWPDDPLIAEPTAKTKKNMSKVRR
ncbi:ATP-dependent helicase HrpB [Kiloniella sp. EL199]|uniref:ATP-dependent helicase HrpB n=1 Tax=Kiloniella sp. EL199 TaxID=2107581 RepID=UPI000EA22BFF|nr:ATP-dependent helicase HrpB [Kiloniella sp. EL199]